MKNITWKKKTPHLKSAGAARKASVKIRTNRAKAKTAVEAEGAPSAKAASPSSIKAGASSVESATASEDRLQSSVVSMEKIGGGINVVQKLLLENGEMAVFKPATGEPLRESITPGEVSDIERARQLFRDAGLAFPTIPDELAAQMKELGPWLFSTRPIDMSPYNLEHYVHEVERTRVKDYAVLCHGGHGINSYAVHYYLVRSALRMFLQLGWGGVYTNSEEAATLIRDCFSVADQIVTEAQKVGTFLAGERLTIVGSEFYGSYWLQPREGRRRKDADREDLSDLKPLEALTEVLGWLKTYRVEKPSKRKTGMKIGTPKERN